MTHPEPTKPTELKPCPWCKRTPRLSPHDDDRYYYVSCQYNDEGHCRVSPIAQGRSAEEAFEIWNTRTPPPASAEIAEIVERYVQQKDWGINVRQRKPTELSDSAALTEAAHKMLDDVGTLITALRAAQARVAEVEKREAALREALAKEVVIMEYDCPGDAPEPCGYECRLCLSEGGETFESVRHAPTCILANTTEGAV